MHIKPERIVLQNGLRIILVPNEASYATTVAVIVTTGSDYEEKQENGVSHFLEHMCFKGTKLRPRPLDIAEELDSLGAEYNAFTSKEYTSYFAKVRADSWKKALDIVSDIYLNSTFDAQEIEKEKGVVVEEMHMYDDQPAEKISDAFTALVYGDQPAGWKIIGSEETVRGLTREAVVRYHAQHYVPAATIVLVSGNFDGADARKEIEQRFALNMVASGVTRRKTLEAQERPQEVLVSKECDQTHLILGFRAFSIQDERRFALSVLASLLGGGMSSRLFQKIREEMGAAYYVSMGTSLSYDRGLVLMSAGVQHAAVKSVIRASLAEFHKVKDVLVAPAELRKVKGHIIGSAFLSLETSEEILYYYGRQEVFGLPLRTPEWFVEQISRVTEEDVRNVAQSIFKSGGLNFAVIGPQKESTYLEELNLG